MLDNPTDISCKTLFLLEAFIDVKIASDDKISEIIIDQNNPQNILEGLLAYLVLK